MKTKGCSIKNIILFSL
jgi:hypothetical protein